MVKVYSLDGMTPVVHPTAYVHPSAVLIGDVIVGPRCYVGPGASMRGDFGRLILEYGANLQDNCVMHGFPDSDTTVGINGHIGHGAVLHGCRIGRDVLVGMNAVVMDDADIGESCIVAAMALVRAGMVVPSYSLVVGAPARIIRKLREEEIVWKGGGAGQYQALVARCLSTMREVDALIEVEPGRKRVAVGMVASQYKPLKS